MISACSARLLSTVAGIRLQILISTQFTEEECLAWGKSLQQDIEEISTPLEVLPILNRLSNDTSFAHDDLRYNAISSSVMGFCSAVEYFIKDIIYLSLKRNSSLRKKALSTIKIRGLELEENASINGIKIKVLKTISNEHSKGRLFNNKFIKASSFLSFEKSFYDKNILERLDAIWELRNKLAHLNQINIVSYKIKSESGEIILERKSGKTEYLNFVVKFIEIINEAAEYLIKWDKVALEKWIADEFIDE